MNIQELKNNFVRDRVFMTHGSLLNGYKGTPKDLTEYKKDSEELFDLAIKLVGKIWDRTHAEVANDNKEPEYDN